MYVFKKKKKCYKFVYYYNRGVGFSNLIGWKAPIYFLAAALTIILAVIQITFILMCSS